MAKFIFKTIFFTELKQIGPVQNRFGPMEGYGINQKYTTKKSRMAIFNHFCLFTGWRKRISPLGPTEDFWDFQKSSEKT